MTEPGTSVPNDELKAKLTNMTTVEIKQELRRRKLKTAGLKNELILRLLPFLQLEREHGETGRGDDAQNKDDEDARRNREDDSEGDSSNDEDESVAEIRRGVRRSQLLTFRDVEESLETFNGDDKVDVRKWIKDFEEMAVLCEWSDIQKVAYAKRLLRGSEIGRAHV